MQIIPENKNVTSLLSTRCQFEIPRFQRDYSWETKHYQEFIDDMLENLKFDNNTVTPTDYFLGTMLFIGTMEKPGNLLKVVDGQQRLTTITILFSALSDHFKEVGEDKEYGLLWIKEYQQEVKPTLKNKKICIIIGHGGSDTGAVSQDRKVTELAYNTEIAEKLAKVLEEQGYENFIHNRGYARIENTTFINSQNPDLVISLHCNSSDNLTATGTEAIHFPNSKNGIRFATILSKNVSEALGIRNRGAKEPYQGRGDGLLRRLKAPAVISEPFFININSDLKLGLERKNEYIQAIVKSINEYFEIK